MTVVIVECVYNSQPGLLSRNEKSECSKGKKEASEWITKGQLDLRNGGKERREKERHLEMQRRSIYQRAH